MADLTTAGAPGGPGLAYRVGREIILMHRALEFFAVDAIQQLLIAHRAQSGHS